MLAIADGKQHADPCLLELFEPSVRPGVEVEDGPVALRVIEVELEGMRVKLGMPVDEVVPQGSPRALHLGEPLLHIRRGRWIATTEARRRRRRRTAD
jgi:hypothetical protein